jgi:Domain of unknown function (DUF4279)
MATIAKSTATLRVFGDDLEPESVTRLLGTEPTDQYRKGETRTTSGGRQYTRKYGMWRLGCEDCAPEALDEQIAEILNGLTDDLLVWQSVTSKYTVDIFCGVFMNESNEGFCLSPITLAALGARRIEIQFDVYASTKKDNGSGVASSDA